MPATGSGSVDNAAARAWRRRALALLPVIVMTAIWSVTLSGPVPDRPPTGPTIAAMGLVTAAEPGLTEPAPAPVPVTTIRAGQAVPIETRIANASGLGQTSSTADIPDVALAAYQRAATVVNSADQDCKMPWQLVAALGRVESNHGRHGGSVLNGLGVATPSIIGVRLDGSHQTTRIKDTDAGQLDGDQRFDRAVGPMQFIPSTWSFVGVDADGDGDRNPQDIDDAALAAAVYLCVGRGDLSTIQGQRAAVYRYNHSRAYVDLVMEIADAYQTDGFWTVSTAGVPTPGDPFIYDPGAGGDGTVQALGEPQAEPVPQATAVLVTPVDLEADPDDEPTDPTGPADPTDPTDANQPQDPNQATDPAPATEPSDGPNAGGSTDPGSALPEPTPAGPNQPDPAQPLPTPTGPNQPDSDPASDPAATLCAELGYLDATQLAVCQPVAEELLATNPTATATDLDAVLAILESRPPVG